MSENVAKLHVVVGDSWSVLAGRTDCCNMCPQIVSPKKFKIMHRSCLFWGGAELWAPHYQYMVFEPGVSNYLRSNRHQTLQTRQNLNLNYHRWNEKKTAKRISRHLNVIFVSHLRHYFTI